MSSTPITLTPAQHAQQDPQQMGLQENQKSTQPSKGNPADHSIYHSNKRPGWANQAKSNKRQAAGMEDHVTEAIQLPPHAAALLDPEDQKTFARSLNILQNIHAECGKRALTPLECDIAFHHLGVLQALNAKALNAYRSQSLPQFPVLNTVEVR